MKKAAILNLCAAVIIALVQAPFFHVHAHEHDDHHHSVAAHLHGAPEPPGTGFQIGANDPDSDVRALDWFQLLQRAPDAVAVDLNSWVLAPVQLSLTEPVRTISPRTHDPPGRSLAGPRAPPAFPCLS